MTDTPKTKPQTAPSDGIWGPAFKEAGVAFVAAALILFIFYVFAFRWIHPEFVPFMDREAAKLIAPGKDLIPVSIGAYRVEGSSGIIEDFNGDEAILALPRAFQAEDYPFIKVNLQGFTRYSKFKILWRRADDPSQTHALEFNRSGDEVTQIAMVYGNDNYRGRIADIALLIYDGPALGFENNDNVAISIQSIELMPFSAWRVTEQIFEDWTNPPLLQGYSNNYVLGAHPRTLLSPNLIINTLLFIATLFVSLARCSLFRSQSPSSNRPFLTVVLCLCCYSWMCSELLRWNWRLEQVADTHQRYSNKNIEERINANPMRCARFPADCKSDLHPYF